jgi:hypothetical protein
MAVEPVVSMGNMPIGIVKFEDSQGVGQAQFYPVLPLLAMTGNDL